jgi:uncharacterized membrane protein
MAGPHQVPSVHEVRKNRPPVRDINAEQRQQFTRLERIAIWITDHVGTMGFFIVIFAWTVLWLFISNMIQIFLMPLLMIGQNLQGRHSEIRAQSDFEVNVKAEKEIDVILMHLENLHVELEQIEAHIDALGEKK